MQRQGEFAESIAVRIGRRVEYFRTVGRVAGQPKMTVQGLADRCTELGLPLDRSVVAKLEKGLRQTITVGEILVLARALEVPPIELVFPIGQDSETEALPGHVMDTWKAVKWFTGEDRLIIDRPQDITTWNKARYAVRLYREHDELTGLREQSISRAGSARQSAATAESDEAREPRIRWAEAEEERTKELERHLRSKRADMRDNGIVPPPLPADLTHLDE